MIDSHFPFREPPTDALFCILLVQTLHLIQRNREILNTQSWPLSLVDHRVCDALVLHETLREPAVTILVLNKSNARTNTHRAISLFALSTESEPWQMLRPVTRAKSPRIVPIVLCQTHIDLTCQHERVPGSEASGLVAPSILRPVLTASTPSQTMATTGPAAIYLIRPGKKGLSLRSS